MSRLLQPISENSETVMYELWYDYVKWKFRGKAKLCYMITDRSIIYIKTKKYLRGYSRC